MSSFLIQKIPGQTRSIDQEQEIFRKQGLTCIKDISLFGYRILLFNRYYGDFLPFYESKDAFIFVSGNLIYKKQTYSVSIKNYLNDFLLNCIQRDQVLGQFTIVIGTKKELSIITDASGLLNIYYNSDRTVISNSLLGILYATPGTQKLNKRAITELLLTGSLISPDTFFEGIRRIERNALAQLKSINFIHLEPIITESTVKSKIGLVNQQLEILDNYFSSVKSLADELGVVIGLTSGFDSRLLMAFAERHFENVEYYTHWRNHQSIEVQIAKKLTNELQKELGQFQVKLPIDMSEVEMLENLESAFYYNDGHIRMQNYWHEPYNTIEYIMQVFKFNRLGLNGIGGEQYRNYERMILPKWNFKSWLEQDILFRYSGDIFRTNRLGRDFYDYYSGKVRQGLQLENRKYINRIDIKRFHNEIYNISNRNIRLNMENNVGHLLCPFVDSSISFSAYNIIDKLGNSLSFQSEMIKKINPSLAKIESDYGFNFYDGENIKSILIGYMKESLPKKLYYKSYKGLKRRASDKTYASFLSKFEFMSNGHKSIADLELDIDESKLSQFSESGWQLISLGYFLNKLDDKIEY